MAMQNDLLRLISAEFVNCAEAVRRVRNRHDHSSASLRHLVFLHQHPPWLALLFALTEGICNCSR